MSKGITVVFGTAGHTTPGLGYEDDKSIVEGFEILEKYNVKNIDTAINYGDMKVETKLGEIAPKDRGFVYSTKWPGFFLGPDYASTESNIVKMGKQSLEKLQIKQIDIFYLHSFDANTPLEDTLKGVNEVHKTGAFKRFGISNFRPEQVQQTYDICKSNGYVLPTVFQGMYNPVMRRYETELFPLLRKLGISFYAYSPLAGGFLTKSKEQIKAGAGRFNKDFIGGAYLYFAKPAHLEILTDWDEAAKEANCSKADLAFRWVTYNSALKPEYGDAIILGANGNKQLAQTLEGLQHGPLDQSAVQKIENVWNAIKHESKLDMFEQ